MARSVRRRPPCRALCGSPRPCCGASGRNRSIRWSTIRYRRMGELHALTASQAARLIRQRELSPVELIEHLLRRASTVDPKVQAWVTLDGERAIAAAKVAEQQTGELPPL